MKKLFLIISTVGLLSFIGPGKTVIENVLKVGIFERSDNLRLKVNILKPEGEVLVVKLQDPNGKIVYTKNTSKSGHNYSFNFNFFDAKSGEYFLIATCGTSVVKREILKINNALSY